MKFILLFLFSIAIWISLNTKNNLSLSEQLIVWSVGQGQMVTYISKTHCHHFDMGGEYFPKKKLFRTCNNKKNRIYYSHWDYDHINFSLKVKKILPSLCRDPSFSDLPIHSKKRKIIQKIPLCTSQNPPFIKEIILPKNISPRNSNESSRIFIINKKALISGDSSSRMEKYWSPFLLKYPIKILITGHHGSRSSTSNFLLNHTPHLQLAVSSARKKRYGHPHQNTIQKLRKRKILFINTEDFGHIRISLDTIFPKAIPF